MGLILPGKRSAVRRSLTRHCLSNVPQESWLGLELVLVEIRVVLPNRSVKGQATPSECLELRSWSGNPSCSPRLLDGASCHQSAALRSERREGFSG